MTDPVQTPMTFKAETRQLLNILIHSLYTEREIFLRELISNASDALTRLDFVMLTERDVLDPDLPLEIRIRMDEAEKLLIIEDSGIGMTRDEMIENLGTIAHSGARAFLEAAQHDQKHISEMIGQFGVGFYSAFMVADWIRVTSRSWQQDAEACTWYATGEDTYTLEAADRSKRGTEITIKLKDDAEEFLKEMRLQQIIKRHSDFIAYPIYLAEGKEQVNRQTALWRQSAREVKAEAYSEFYKQLTHDFEDQLLQTHLSVDAPAQMYALLFIPANPQNLMFSPRKEPGLKLYAHKVLIKEFCTDLLPEYLNFVQGVVDSEDLPLNVSRESVQSNRVMAQLKRLVTSKVLDALKTLAKDDPQRYNTFWQTYGQRLKEGIAADQDDPEPLYPLLRFKTVLQPDEWTSLDAYLEKVNEAESKIYYILSDDPRAVAYSPHLDPFRKSGRDVLVMSDPVDAFMLMRLTRYNEHDLVNVADADAKLPDEADEAETPQPENALPEDQLKLLSGTLKTILGDAVTDVRTNPRLSQSAARLVNAEGSINQSMEKVYRMLNRDVPEAKKVLEINPAHPIITRLAGLSAGDERLETITHLIYENALLAEGLAADPQRMIDHVQALMRLTLEK